MFDQRAISLGQVIGYSNSSGQVIGYSDSYFAGDLDERRSLTGYVF